MGEALRYGLIGCGRIAPNHLRAALDCEGLAPVALCDLSAQKAEELCQMFDLSEVKIYTDYHTMLTEENLDFVAIATDSKSHAQIALDCIGAGCHLVVEKPLALSVADADAVLAAAEARGVVVSACHQNRFNRAVQKVKASVAAGEFGRLFHLSAQVRWNRGEAYYRQAPWRGRWDADGGALMNQCIHCIDLLLWMAGQEPVEVFAYTDRLNHPHIEAEDLGLALVRFRGGAYGVIEGTTNVFPANLEETLAVFGEHGTAKMGGKSLNLLDTFLVAGQEGEEAALREIHSEAPENIYGFGHPALYRDVVEAIRQGRPPLVDGEAGKRAMELVLAIYLSAATGQPVPLPLERCATTDFVGRFD